MRGGRLPRPPARDIGVPVIVLPAGAPWGAVIAALVAAIAGGAGRARAAPARVALRGPLIEGRGIPASPTRPAELLGAPVAILDEYLDLRALRGLSGEQEAFLDAAVGRARGHGPASMVGPFVEEAMDGISRELVHGAAGRDRRARRLGGRRRSRPRRRPSSTSWPRRRRWSAPARRCAPRPSRACAATSSRS